MKRCSSCKEFLQESLFNKNKAKKDGLNSLCRACSNKRSKRYYIENTEKHKKNVALHNIKRRIEFKKRIREIKTNNPCLVCKESAICCLDFHHKDPTSKKIEVALLVKSHTSWRRIQDEIDKCVIICSNCHRKLHAGLLTLPENEIDNLVERWHNGEGDSLELQEFLGFTPEEYKNWVENGQTKIGTNNTVSRESKGMG